jgi:ribosomal protein L22
MQIIQFVIGASFAFAHLFIAYQIPVSVPYTFSLADLTSVASAVTTDASSAVSTATATAAAGVASWIKKLAFRAAGREGLAENVVNDQGETFGIDAVHAAEDLKAREEIRYRDELQWIHCTDTSGQAFAILLNCMYLAPLTFLFVKFFIRAYSERLERRRSSTAYNLEQSAKDAFHGVARQAVDAIGDMHGTGDGEKISTEEAIESTKESIKEQAKSIQKSPPEGLESAKQSANEGVKSILEKGQENAESTKQSSEQVLDSTKQSADEGADSAKDLVEEGEEGVEVTEESSTSEKAATTEPMAEGGDLADTKTELHEEDPQ